MLRRTKNIAVKHYRPPGIELHDPVMRTWRRGSG